MGLRGISERSRNLFGEKESVGTAGLGDIFIRSAFLFPSEGRVSQAQRGRFGLCAERPRQRTFLRRNKKNLEKFQAVLFSWPC